MDNTLKPGINYMECWVSDLANSVKFYDSFLPLIGWKKISRSTFSNGKMAIYFKETNNIEKTRSIGIRHLCFQATEEKQVYQAYDKLMTRKAEFIREPILMPYSPACYSLDFYDPDGQVNLHVIILSNYGLS